MLAWQGDGGFLRNFQNEANGLFKDVQFHARRARSHADRLKSYAVDSDLGWQAYADQLTQMRSEINSMGDDLCRLETIHRVLAPWQQRSVDRIATAVRLLADNTQDAILFENANQRMLWSPTFQNYLDNLSSQARNLTASVGNAVEYAKVGTEYRDLRHDLGMKTSS